MLEFLKKKTTIAAIGTALGLLAVWLKFDDILQVVCEKAGG